MHAPVQGADEIVIDAPANRIFEILEDSTRLPDWTSVISTSATREAAGSVRNCEVDLDGRRGRVVERCVESVPPHRIAWAMEQDTFGFARLLADFGFSFTLEPAAGGRTLVRNETYYRPRGMVSAAMNVLLLRRKFGGVRRRWLVNLKRISEEPGPAATTQPSETRIAPEVRSLPAQRTSSSEY